MEKFIIASTTPYIKRVFKFKNTKKRRFIFIKKQKELSIKSVSKIKPKIIFLPHWNWILKKEIFEKFNCIGFHCTPLPFGRGGSPLQNMIIRGREKSTVCAIKIDYGIDTGPIYLREKISFKGRAEDIMFSLNIAIAKMILKLSKKLNKPKKQKGKAYYFKRRKPAMSILPKSSNIKRMYDHVRMLDINLKKFPKAFIRYGNFKIIFEEPKLFKKKLICNTTFYKKIN